MSESPQTSDAPGPSNRRTLPGSVVVLIGGAAAVIVLAGIRATQSTVASTLLALILVIAVLPLGRWALRRGWKSWIAVTIMVIATYVILIVLVGGLVWSIAQLATTLPSYSGRLSDLLKSALKVAQNFGISSSSASTSLSKLDLGTVVSVLQSVLSSVLSALAILAFIVVLLLFLAADTLGVAKRWQELGQQKPAFTQALADFAHGTQQYLLVSAAFGLVVAIFDTAALYILSVPLALTWGLLSFLTNFVPNVGFVLGLVPPAVLALLDQGVGTMIWVIAVYIVLNVVIQVVIQPRIVGDSVGLTATVTFLALTFWGFVLGPLGALLAVPATLLVKALFVDADPSAGWLRILISPPPSTDAAPKTSRLRFWKHGVATGTDR